MLVSSAVLICQMNKFMLLLSSFWNQANHRITTQMQRRIYGHATDVEIRPLNEEKAVQAAVDLLGEIFVFSVGYLFISIFLFLGGKCKPNPFVDRNIFIPHL